MQTPIQKQEEGPAKDEHGCVTETEEWNGEKCVAKAQKETKIEDAAPLINRVMGVMSDVMTKKLGDFEKKIDEKIDSILKTKEIEVERALRKGFGLESDPVIHMSDLIAYGRKQALEKADTGKRTPATDTGGPEGTVKPDPIQKMFTNVRKGAA